MITLIYKVICKTNLRHDCAKKYIFLELFQEERLEYCVINQMWNTKP